MNDADIQNKITKYFRKHSLADLSQIEVFVKEGEVILQGEAPTKTDKEFAEFVVKRMWEVKKMTSNINLLTEATTKRLPPLHRILQNA